MFLFLFTFLCLKGFNVARDAIYATIEELNTPQINSIEAFSTDLNHIVKVQPLLA